MAASPLGPVPGLGYADPASKHSLIRISDSAPSADVATIAEEVPVALVYNGEPFVVVMASPADLEDLAIGFTLTERIVDDATSIGTITVVRHSRGVELQVSVDDTAAAGLAGRRRGISARTGCGVCGIESIDEVLRAPRPVDGDRSFEIESLWKAAAQLESRQPVNAETRAVHAAAFADSAGNLLVAREDVGRHNALDKVIGALVRANVERGEGFAVVTSRASYELVQKTATAGIPLLAAVSRPTSLAIQLAEQANVGLVGLLRGRTASVYSRGSRLGLPGGS